MCTLQCSNWLGHSKYPIPNIPRYTINQHTEKIWTFQRELDNERQIDHFILKTGISVEEKFHVEEWTRKTRAWTAVWWLLISIEERKSLHGHYSRKWTYEFLSSYKSSEIFKLNQCNQVHINFFNNNRQIHLGIIKMWEHSKKWTIWAPNQSGK